MSRNKKLPWSFNLIEKYKDRWEWFYLSGNEKLQWNESWIEKFKEKLNWNELGRNANIFWSVELIETYMDKWNKHFFYSDTVWENAFKPFVDDSMIEEVMKRIK